MRVFKNRPFARFATKAGITDAALCQVIQAAEHGLIAAQLGGSIIKQRIARPGHGKSGGFRALIVYKANSRAFFIHGFAKNEKDNVALEELVALKKLASELLSYDDDVLARVVALGSLTEVVCDEKTVPQSFDGVDPRNR